MVLVFRLPCLNKQLVLPNSTLQTSGHQILPNYRSLLELIQIIWPRIIKMAPLNVSFSYWTHAMFLLLRMYCGLLKPTLNF